MADSFAPANILRFLEFFRRRETRNFVADITAKLAPLVVPLGNPVSAHFAPSLADVFALHDRALFI